MPLYIRPATVAMETRNELVKYFISESGSVPWQDKIVFDKRRLLRQKNVLWSVIGVSPGRAITDCDRESGDDIEPGVVAKFVKDDGKLVVYTVHEYQGKQARNVKLVRLNHKTFGIYKSKPHVFGCFDQAFLFLGIYICYWGYDW